MSVTAKESGAPSLSREPIELCGKMLAKSFDAVHGGFGPAPKFPRPVVFDLLFHLYALFRFVVIPSHSGVSSLTYLHGYFFRSASGATKPEIARRAQEMAVLTLDHMGKGIRVVVSSQRSSVASISVCLFVWGCA
jgi:hypothetical protein